MQVRCLEPKRVRRAEVCELIAPLEALRSAADALQRTFVRDEFLCPITQEVMVEPVTCADGHSYERQAIEQWLRQQTDREMPLTSPKTNEPLAHPHINPNHQLRALIRAAHPEAF